MDANQKAIAESILSGSRVIAVVGASPNPSRPSNIVASYLIENGFEVIPVRPNVREILGCMCYGSIEEIPCRVDVVDVFRKSEACPEIARAAVSAGAGALWLQEGIISEDAARIAREGGLPVVADLCIKKIHEGIHGNP
ncbi:MAG: CoA-binding protein [Thermoleophilia bacterium]|nr:CoA-binding protein [Thermoleophilia bacterium]